MPGNVAQFALRCTSILGTIILTLAESNRNEIRYGGVGRNDRSIEFRDGDII